MCLCVMVSYLHSHWVGVCVCGKAAVYEEQCLTFLPVVAWSCRSTVLLGCCPGCPFIRDRFLTHPDTPEENFPPVRTAMFGAPPVTHTHTIQDQRKTASFPNTEHVSLSTQSFTGADVSLTQVYAAFGVHHQAPAF